MKFLEGTEDQSETFESHFEEEEQEVPLISTAPQLNDDEVEDKRM